jgi:phage shock protein PspC (stress-responsive transcriptional regulator)
MLLDASAATAQTIALLVTFVIAVGGVANVLIVYIIAEVMAERRQNGERRERGF